MNIFPSRLVISTLLPLLAAGMIAVATDEQLRFDVLRIHYADGSGRIIDYDFTSGEIDENGTLEIPEDAVIGIPDDASNAVYTWSDPFGFDDAVLDTTPPGRYSVIFDADDPFPYLYAALAGDDQAAASGTWSWEVETRNGPATEIGVEADMWFPLARFFAGFHEVDEDGIPGVLFLNASLHNPETGGFLWTHTETVELSGNHSLSDSISLRMSFSDDGQTMKTEYRLENETWETFAEHTLDAGVAPVFGLFDTSPYVEMYDSGGFLFSPSLMLGNPDWEIIISSFGYSDILNDLTSGSEGREYLSGEWGAAVAYTLSESGPVPPTWLEPYFLFPDWITNSDFEEISPIEHTSDNADSAASTIANDHLEIEQTFEMVDTVFGLPLGLIPATGSSEGESVRSSRYALRHTYHITNISGETITDLNLFQLLHGLQSEVSLYDDRPYPGPYQEYRYTTTQIGVDTVFDFDDSIWDDDFDWEDFDWTDEGAEFEDYISFLSSVPPVAFENSHFGIEGEDSHFEGKPSVGTHLSIEENALNNVAYFAPDERWVAGAQQWDLGSLAPGETVSFDVLLTVSTGSRISPEKPAGSANGGAAFAGGVDFILRDVTSTGTVFVRHLAANAEERDAWISQGELPEITFHPSGDSLQAWNVSTTANFNGPAVLTFGYHADTLANDLRETRLAAFHWNGANWEPLDSMVDPWNRKITAATEGFSWFALGAGDRPDPRYHTDDFSGAELDSVRWEDPAGTNNLLFRQRNSRLQVHAEGGEPGTVSVASRAVFRLDEAFRARVDFNATHFSSTDQGELALAVFPGADRPGNGIPDDLILIGNGTLDRESAPAGRKWVALRSSGGEIEALTHSTTGESTGTLYVDYADGVFHVAQSGYGQPNALASFALDDWAETDLVTIALLAFSDGHGISPRNAVYFDSFAIERSPAGTFAEWADAVAGADSADPATSVAADAIPNLLRHAVGAGPYEPALRHLPVIAGASGDSHRIEFRRNTRASDLVVTLESSEDLAEWTAIATGNPGTPLQVADGQPYSVQEIPVDGAVTAISIIPSDPQLSPSRTFYRLRVETTGP